MGACVRWIPDCPDQPVHHGFLGAAAGCLIGRHEAKKQARLEQMQRNQQNQQKH